MKNLGFIAVLALLMMFGCSKDEVITTEQEPFSVEKNNQPVINGARPGSATMSVSGISFFSSSIKNDLFIKQWTQEDKVLYPYLTLNRNILSQGNFSGKLSGYGTINSSLSRYTFSSCIEAPIDSPPNYGEPLMYKLIADGIIYIGTRDYCSITITGNLYPWFNAESNFDGGLFIGKATTHSGFGKLKNFNKTFEVYRSGVNIYNINLKTGEIGLNIRD